MKQPTLKQWKSFLGLKENDRLAGLENHLREIAKGLEDWEWGENVDPVSATIGAAVMLWEIQKNAKVGIYNSEKTDKPVMYITLLDDLQSSVEGDIKEALKTYIEVYGAGLSEIQQILNEAEQETD